MIVAEGYENYNPDEIKTYEEINVGLEGMRIDRELFEKFFRVLGTFHPLNASISQ